MHLLNLALLSVILTASQSAPNPIRTVSHGEAFAMEKYLQPEKPTVFAFYIESSSAEKAVVDQLKDQAKNSAGIGLRLVPMQSLTSPAARNYEILQTPTIMVLDRFGRLLVRTSKVEDIDASLVKAFNMVRLKWISETDPEAAKTYRMMGGGARKVPEIMKTMSLRPDLMEGIMRIAQMGHFTNGYLPRKTKEMIATYVSAINHCKY